MISYQITSFELYICLNSQQRSMNNENDHLMTDPLFPARPVIKCFVIPPNQTKTELRRNRLLYPGCLIKLPRFEGARPDYVQIKSSCCSFPRELVNFVRPRELMSFDPRHVTRFPPIGRPGITTTFDHFDLTCL